MDESDKKNFRFVIVKLCARVEQGSFIRIPVSGNRLINFICKYHTVKLALEDYGAKHYVNVRIDLTKKTTIWAGNWWMSSFDPFVRERGE